MDIIPLKSLPNQSTEPITGGITTPLFNEFDDEEEQEMMEEGVYSRGAHPNVLNMQNDDDDDEMQYSPRQEEVFPRYGGAKFESRANSSFGGTKVTAGTHLDEEVHFTAGYETFKK